MDCQYPFTEEGIGGESSRSFTNQPAAWDRGTEYIHGVSIQGFGGCFGVDPISRIFVRIRNAVLILPFDLEPHKCDDQELRRYTGYSQVCMSLINIVYSTAQMRTAESRTRGPEPGAERQRTFEWVPHRLRDRHRHPLSSLSHTSWTLLSITSNPKC